MCVCGGTRLARHGSAGGGGPAWTCSPRVTPSPRKRPPTAKGLGAKMDTAALRAMSRGILHQDNLTYGG